MLEGRLTSHSIREMKINEALKLIEKYDDEINDIDLSETLNFLKLTRIEFLKSLKNIGIMKSGKKAGINTL